MEVQTNRRPGFPAGKKATFIFMGLAVVVLALFHRLYVGYLCDGLCSATVGVLGLALSGYQALMLHHFYMFALVFIPTVWLQAKKGIDFGYHLSRKNSALKSVCAAAAFALPVSLINGLFHVTLDLKSVGFSYVIFQLFFSGLGEEVLFRSIPLAILDRIRNGAERRDSGSVDIPVILSAVLFAIAHISGGQPLYSQIYSFLVVTAAGLLYGWMYRKTGSVWICMLGHGVYNIVVSIFPAINFFIG